MWIRDIFLHSFSGNWFSTENGGKFTGLPNTLLLFCSYATLIEHLAGQPIPVCVEYATKTSTAQFMKITTKSILMTTTFRFYFTEIPLLVHCSLVSFNIFTPYNAMAPKENGFSQIVAIFLYYLYYYEFLLFSDGVWIKSTSFERAPSIFPIKCIPLTDTIYIDI